MMLISSSAVSHLIEDWVWSASSVVSPDRAFNPPAFNGQLHPMCPCFLQLKQCPSFWRVTCSSLVRAALAQVHPGVRSMAFGSLANFCCHCCLVGFCPKDFWGWFFLPPKTFCHIWYFLCWWIAASTQLLKWVDWSTGSKLIIDPWSPWRSPWKNFWQTMVSSMLYSPIQTTCLKSAMYLLRFPRSILRVKISPLARSLFMWSWNVSVKLLMTVVQIHSSVSLPPKARCLAIIWLVSCTHAFTQGPWMYPKNRFAQSNGVPITLVRWFKPW